MVDVRLRIMKILAFIQIKKCVISTVVISYYSYKIALFRT